MKYITFFCGVLGELRLERLIVDFEIVLLGVLQLAAQLDSPVNWFNL